MAVYRQSANSGMEMEMMMMMEKMMKKPRLGRYPMGPTTRPSALGAVYRQSAYSGMKKMMMMKTTVRAVPDHLCYGPLKVSSEIALRNLNEQKDIFTIWENFVPELFIQTAVSRERNKIS